MKTSSKNENSFPIEQLQQLEISRNGNIMPRIMNLSYDCTLKGSLLSVLYPGIKVACVLVPVEPLDELQESLVRNAMANLLYKGIRYKLVGAASSAKNGLFYFVDEAHHQPIADRFHRWPQAAISYFGILVSSCGVVADLPEARVLVVADRDLGTNDCGAWIRESLATNQLGLRPGMCSQFRIAFEHTQGKGTFKLMGDDVADLLDADIVLPKSCIKPGFTMLDRARNVFRSTFRGRTIIGIREVSRQLEFESSYTLTQHAPAQSILDEILKQTTDLVNKVSESIGNGDYQELLTLIGHNPEIEADEVGTVEGLLLADRNGEIVNHPWVHAQLDKLLARWTYKACTGGAFHLPAFALAHDGYLAACQGKVYYGSDWIPKDHAICGLGSRRGLCVRYPIRMYDDLLPVEHMPEQEVVLRLREELEKQGCPEVDSIAGHIISTQLRMKGTYVLHSKTAELNGGDYDFDLVGVIEQDRFPLWVADRFGRERTATENKNKPSKDKHPWYNLIHVARKAIGNQIGAITDLITSCLANGRRDLAADLVGELQKALDSLKHGVEPDLKKIEAIRKEVDPTPWLRLKHERRVSDLPKELEVKETDTIGLLYNHVRPHFATLLPDPAPLEAFLGLIEGERVTKQMIADCHHVHTAYGAVVASIAQRKAALKDALTKARKEWEAVRNSADKRLRKEKLFAKTQAQAAYYYNEERSKDEMQAIISFLKVWAQNKTTSRMAWAQALNSIVCRVKSNGDYRPTGSLMYITFPQELVTRLAEITGGRKVQLYKPRMVEGFVRTDQHGRTFLVEVVKQQLKETFLFACRNGEFSLDAAIPIETKKEPEQAEPATPTGEIEDPQGLGHEVADDVIFQAEHASEYDNSSAPF
jgi:hypothetical protein